MWDPVRAKVRYWNISDQVRGKVIDRNKSDEIRGQVRCWDMSDQNSRHGGKLSGAEMVYVKHFFSAQIMAE